LDKDKQKRIISPQLDLEYITNGEEFKVMAKAFSTMRDNKNNPKVLHEAVKMLNKSLLVCFHIDTTIAIVDSVGQLGFYGFSIYPSIKCMRKIIEKLSKHDFSDIREIWQTNDKWHIDIDGQLLYDLSNNINPMEMATLLLYVIEQSIFDYDTPMHIAYTIAKYNSKMNVMSRYIADSPRMKEIYMIPFMIGCSFTNFIYGNEELRDHMVRNSILLSGNGVAYERYSSAVKKILFRYGRGDIIDQSPFEFEKKIVYVLIWIYEGLNDLRHSSLRLKENLKRHLTTCRSPFVRLVFKTAIMNLSRTGDPGSDPISKWKETEESMNPDMKALVEKQEIDFWKNYVTTMESRIVDEYLDKYGNCKKITNEDIDMVRVECESIESVDDKVYLLEKLYKHISAINMALDMIKSGQGKKVKQTKNELEHLAQYAEETRQYILRYKIPPKGYGLYIKYPPGYEG
jgi:hypothetical protein